MLGCTHNQPGLHTALGLQVGRPCLGLHKRLNSFVFRVSEMVLKRGKFRNVEIGHLEISKELGCAHSSPT